MSKSETPPSRLERWKGWLSFASMAATLIFGTFLTAWLSVLSSRVDEARLTLDRYGATSNYIELISDSSSPGYVKSMAFASMLKYELMEPAILFSAAYQAEDLHGPGITKQLFYEYGKNHQPMALPIGYVDLLRHYFGISKIKGHVPMNGAPKAKFRLLRTSMLLKSIKSWLIKNRS